MLDENLPTFRLKPSSDNPHSSLYYFTQNGSDPAAEYLFRRADPAVPASRNKYAIALCDPYNAGVVYGEVMIEPQWSQPTLSAAEVRAQTQAGAPPAAVMPLVPDMFTVQLYNPDQAVTVKMVTGSWGKSDTWEFDLPVQTFRTPTTSELDREQQDTSPAAPELIPRVMFRWKKDSRLSKDMTCYMSGTRLGARKNKEPDITVALFKAARESVLTVYQPNLHRVEVEDRKGLELVMLLSSEVIKDLWVAPKPDVFNVQGGGGPTPNGNKGKNSRPVGTSPPAAGGVPAMSGALANAPPSQPPPSTAHNNPPGAGPASNPQIDAETRRLQAMLEREQRERDEAERAEQERIAKMIEDEEKERRRREAEIAQETERLRQMYGVEGQQLPSDRPPLPPRAQGPPGGLSPQQQLSPWGYTGAGPALPPRPVSAGPQQPGYQPPPPPSQTLGQGQGQQGAGSGGPFHSSTLNTLWKGAAGQLQHLQQSSQQQGRPGGRRKSEEEKRKVQKKRSSHW